MKTRLNGGSTVNMRIVRIGKMKHENAAVFSVILDVVPQPRDVCWVEMFDKSISLGVVLSIDYLLYAYLCAYSCEGHGRELRHVFC